MGSIDYLTPFAEVSRTLCDGADINCTMSLIAGKIAKTLDLKGCFIKMKNPGSDHIELVASCGLSQRFLLDKSEDTSDCVCSHLPEETICVPRLQDGELTSERELMMVEGIEAFAVLPVEVEQEVVAMVALFAAAPREFTKTEFSFAHAEEGIRKILSVPLMVRGEFIGVLRILTAERPPFTKNEINLASAIAEQCAFAIENARIYQRLQQGYEQLLIDFGYEGSSN